MPVRILVAEDDRLQADVVRRYLEREGHATTVVYDGRAAVVRWQGAGALGISFDSELDGREVSALVERSQALAAWRRTRE